MLRLPADVLAAVVAHCSAEHPREACGLVAGPAGQDQLADRHIPMANAAGEPGDTFAFDPVEQLGAYADMDARGEDPVVLYHSHPVGPARPSPVDVAMASGGSNSIWLIVATGDQAPVARAWRIVDDRATEVDIQVVEHDQPARPVPAAG